MIVNKKTKIKKDYVKVIDIPQDNSQEVIDFFQEQLSQDKEYKGIILLKLYPHALEFIMSNWAEYNVEQVVFALEKIKMKLLVESSDMYVPPKDVA